MKLVTLLIFTLLMVCSLLAQSEASFCASKFEGGKLVSEGDCENQSSGSILRDLDAKVKEREAKTKEISKPETTTSPATGTGSTASSMAPYFNTGQCEFIISDICYWSYLEYTKVINFTEAQQICKDKGSVPAYFPTELPYNKTVENLRVKMNADGIHGMMLYTGVLVDEQTFKVTYPDTVVFMKWSSGEPSSRIDGTSVILYIPWTYHDSSQGMWNKSPSSGEFGVVCQNNLN